MFWRRRWVESRIATMISRNDSYEEPLEKMRSRPRLQLSSESRSCSVDRSYN